MSEFWHIVALAFWVAFVIPAGVLATSWFPGLVWLWVALNIAVAYLFNKARKHSQPDRYDDRFSTERINSAIARWVEEVRSRKARQGRA